MCYGLWVTLVVPITHGLEGKKGGGFRKLERRKKKSNLKRKMCRPNFVWREREIIYGHDYFVGLN